MKTKVCTKCKKELSINNFYKGNGKDGLCYRCKICAKQYNQENKETIAAQRKQYCQGNRETIAEYGKQYKRNNKAPITEQRKQYFKQYCQNNKVAIAKRVKQYQQEHLEENCVREQRRRARKSILLSTLTIQQWESIKLYFNDSCAYCGKELPLTQEHVIPLSKGGEYSHNNIICACQLCNSSKGNKLLNNWYPTYKHYLKKREQIILNFLNYKGGVQQLTLAIL